MKYRWLAAVLILVVFGIIRMPIETKFAEERQSASIRNPKFTLNLRQQLGQMSFLAAVGGFRGLVSDYCYLNAHAEWSRVEWGRMKLNFDAATALQPHCILFWEQAGWHMAYNASVAARQNRDEKREALRIKTEHEYWKIGEDYFIRGIANNPDSPTLYDRLGMLYRDKFQDHCKAADVLTAGAKVKGAPVYMHRFAAYELAQCPGHEREAYDLLLGYYKKGEDERLPTLLKTLGNLQEKLHIPADQKIYIPPAANP